MKSVNNRRLVCMLIGNIMMGLGISIFKFASLGNDPFAGMNISISSNLNLSYGTVALVINALFFIAEFKLQKSLIGLGTLVNWFLSGYFVDLFDYVINRVFDKPEIFIEKFIILIIGVMVMSLAISLYQTADMGVSSYDSMSLILSNKTGWKYFACRMITDAACTIICLATGGFIGIGTIISVLCLGPIINLFSNTISKKLVGTTQ